MSKCIAGVGGEHEGAGGLKEASGQVVGGIGGFSGPSGKKEAGIGGKGEELHDQHVGRVWRFEEGGDRNGGSGLDSSVESSGTEGVCRNGQGGIEVEDRRVDFAEEDCVGVGGSGSRESAHGHMFETCSRQTSYHEFIAFPIVSNVDCTNRRANLPN